MNTDRTDDPGLCPGANRLSNSRTRPKLPSAPPPRPARRGPRRDLHRHLIAARPRQQSYPGGQEGTSSSIGSGWSGTVSSHPHHQDAISWRDLGAEVASRVLAVRPPTGPLLCGGAGSARTRSTPERIPRRREVPLLKAECSSHSALAWGGWTKAAGGLASMARQVAPQLAWKNGRVQKP